jgi:predicted nucleic acid-binding Zn ribbon protein
MDSMRDVLKRNLARSLETLSPADRLAAAWPVACGKAMADRGYIAGFEDGIVRIEVESSAWLEQMRSMQGVLQAELAKIAGVRIDGIHFHVKGFRREKTR